MPRNPITMKFGQTVHKRRHELKLTIEELAKRTELTPKYIEAVESGDREPSLSTLWVLARGLELAPNELLS